MKPIRLEDLIPEPAEFELHIRPGESFHLRPFNLDDRLWLQRAFGGPEEVKKVFDPPDFPAICRVVYHQLVEKDRFVATEEDVYDDDGVKTTRLVTGPEKLWKSLVTAKDQFAVLNSLVKTIGVSEPVREQERQEKKSRSGHSARPASPKSST